MLQISRIAMVFLTNLPYRSAETGFTGKGFGCIRLFHEDKPVP